MTSILELESLKKHLPVDFTEAPRVLAEPANLEPEPKPVSGPELVRRAVGLFTPEEADALGRRIEESCEQVDA